MGRPLLVIFVAVGLDEGVEVDAGMLLGAAVSPAPTSKSWSPTELGCRADSGG